MWCHIISFSHARESLFPAGRAMISRFFWSCPVLFLSRREEESGWSSCRSSQSSCSSHSLARWNMMELWRRSQACWSAKKSGPPKCPFWVCGCFWYLGSGIGVSNDATCAWNWLEGFCALKRVRVEMGWVLTDLRRLHAFSSHFYARLVPAPV